jgi:hypothetical protein
MQEDLEKFFQYYNNERAHQGRNMKGKTPIQTFKDGIVKEQKGGSAA